MLGHATPSYRVGSSRARGGGAGGEGCFLFGYTQMASKGLCTGYMRDKEIT